MEEIELGGVKGPARCRYFVVDIEGKFSVEKMARLLTALYDKGHIPMFKMLATNEIEIGGTEDADGEKG